MNAYFLNERSEAFAVRLSGVKFELPGCQRIASDRALRAQARMNLIATLKPQGGTKFSRL